MEFVSLKIQLSILERLSKKKWLKTFLSKSGKGWKAEKTQRKKKIQKILHSDLVGKVFNFFLYFKSSLHFE